MDKNGKQWCDFIKQRFPEYFKDKKVLDVGSLDINGCNRYLFEGGKYIGLDLGPGKNVDVFSIAHEYKEPDNSFDTIISTFTFEHDMYFEKTIKNIIRLLKPNGLFLFACGSIGCREHGTVKTGVSRSPLTCSYGKGWEHYYKNITEEAFKKIVNLDETFSNYEITYLKDPGYLFFWGILK